MAEHTARIPSPPSPQTKNHPTPGYLLKRCRRERLGKERWGGEKVFSGVEWGPFRLRPRAPWGNDLHHSSSCQRPALQASLEFNYTLCFSGKLCSPVLDVLVLGVKPSWLFNPPPCVRRTGWAAHSCYQDTFFSSIKGKLLINEGSAFQDGQGQARTLNMFSPGEIVKSWAEIHRLCFEVLLA